MGLVEVFLFTMFIGFIQDGNPSTLCISGCGLLG
jgi:hypothetical protein